MKLFNSLNIYSEAPVPVFAAELLCNEINSRIDGFASMTDSAGNADIILSYAEDAGRDGFIITVGDCIVLSAKGIRGFVFAVGKFLRNIVKSGNGIELVRDISGRYSPDKSIRGHQLGYRTTPNTYDAWSYDDYYRYYLDLMFFGVNTVEHIPYQSGVSKRNRLMKYDEEEFLVRASELADDLDLDVSLWHPNYDNETDESAALRRKKLYAKLKRLDYVFIPGGDPGNLPADVFINRCIAVSKALKEVHPEAQMWPSAQMPREIPGWADVFIEKMNLMPAEIDGIIYGPNHALPLEELREKLPGKYPLRFYPDITHNVRCEYPVHYYDNDWHFALCTGLSRECTNPRPLEYTRLHRETRDYVIGSVSYSEGITDDVNKAVWSALDYDGSTDSADAVAEYSRLFFFGADTEKLSSLIFALEKNWYGDPAENDGIDDTFNGFSKLYDTGILNENWRFLQLYFRAVCDKVIRDRRRFELKLIDEAYRQSKLNNTEKAIEILSRDYGTDYKELRKTVDFLAKKLFDLIGLQTDVRHYCADSWERGAVLETIDLPVTDRAYLLSHRDDLPAQFERNKVGEGEYHYSVALNGIERKQAGEMYLNFQGDRPGVNTGNLPTALFNVYDNYSFVCDVDGLSENTDYKLRVTYCGKPDDSVSDFSVTVDGRTAYSGKQFINRDFEYEARFCKEGFVTAVYDIPSEFITGKTFTLKLSSESECIMFSEFSFLKK